MDKKTQQARTKALLKAAITVRAAFNRAALSGTESLGMQILLLLTLESGLSLKQCAEKLSATQSNVSTAVTKLVDSKLVKRSPSKADPRVHSLELTPAGERKVGGFIAESRAQ